MSEYQDTKTIGGSDVGALMGVNKYSTAQKIYDRLVDPIPHHGNADEDNANMRRGKLMEPVIAEEYTYNTGRKLQKIDRIFHPQYEYCHASPDYVIVNDRAETDGPGPLEIKCHNSWAFRQAIEEGVNPSYYVQLQHYLWVTGWTWGSFGLFWADGWELHWFDVPRDPEMIERIENTVGEFWHKHILPRTPPSGTVTPVEIAGAKRGQSTDVVKRDDSPFLAMEAKFKLACEAFDLAKHTKELMQNKMIEMVGDVRTAVGAEGRFTKGEGTNTSLDKDAFKKAHPTINLDEYVKRTSYEKFTVTWKKAR